MSGRPENIFRTDINDRYVVVDAHGEGVRLLEHHAHAAAQVGQLHLAGKDVLALQPHIALDILS